MDNSTIKGLPVGGYSITGYMYEGIMIDHTDSNEIDRLIEDLRDTPRGKKTQILVDVMEAKLMKGSLLDRFAAMLFGWERLIFAIYTGNPEGIDRLWNACMDHIQNGKDKIDSNSAGGFSGPEMECFIQILESRGYRVNV